MRPLAALRSSPHNHFTNLTRTHLMETETQSGVTFGVCRRVWDRHCPVTRTPKWLSMLTNSTLSYVSYVS